MALFNWFRAPAKKPTRRLMLGVQQLDDRLVPTVGLASAFGTTGVSQANDVAVDAAGNSYLTGWFRNTLDFDPANDRLGGSDIMTAAGASDIFVAKYDADNALVWVRRMGGTGNGEAGQAIDVDAAGNVFVTGRFVETAMFDSTTLTSAGRADGFAVKLTSGGTVSWAKRWGTGADDVGLGIEVDATGNASVIGGRTFYQPSGATYMIDDNHGLDVLKYSPTGGTVWAPKWVNTRFNAITGDLGVDAAGNLYVAGTFAGTVDFDTGTNRNQTYTVASGPGHDGFVLKLTVTGAFAWVSSFKGQPAGSAYGYSTAQSLALDGGGNVFVSGYYGSMVDFDKGSGMATLPAGGGGYVAKLTPTGGLAWTRALEKDPTGTNFIMVNGLATDAAGSVYATGLFYGGYDFDPGAGSAVRRSDATASPNASDAFVVKLTAAGDFAWAETFGGSGADSGWGIAVDPSGLVYLTGGYTGLVDFDPDPLRVSNQNSSTSSLYLVKLR